MHDVTYLPAFDLPFMNGCGIPWPVHVTVSTFGENWNVMINFFNENAHYKIS
jgi:hypothetical protein